MARSLYPTIIIQANGQVEVPLWQDAVADAWRIMPKKAQQVANSLVTSITIVDPHDPRLRLGYTQSPKAALIGNDLVISCEEDAIEMWHEVGHIISNSGLTPEESRIVRVLYKSSNSQQTLEEQLAEDFYFTVKGDVSSPFWQWWFDNDSEESCMGATTAENIINLIKTAGVGPLQIVDAILDTLAEELIYEFGNEYHILFYGMAKEALSEAQKEDRLSYENRAAPHQYFFTEDIVPGVDGRPKTSREPLQVAQPDVTMRGK